jgi:GDPmannose 4,6-dehydratase
MKKALITGITGQDGSYLAEFLLSKGYEVHGMIRRASTFNTQRIDHIYKDPHNPGARLHLHYGDLSDPGLITHIIYNVRPDEVYHLGAQSHVRVSFDLPEYTGDITGLGTTRILEAIRRSGVKSKFYQASSSELFGSAKPPQSETTAFLPRSPYAIAKLYSYWMAVNYRQSYGIFASNGILFNHESPRRGETFVTRKITRAITNILSGRQEMLFLGNLDAKRDWGFAAEYVELMWRILQHSEPDDFVMGTGKSYSVREFLEACCGYVGVELAWQGKGIKEIALIKSFDDRWKPTLKKGRRIVAIDSKYFRPSEVDFLQADMQKAREKLNWETRTSFEDLMHVMMDYEFLSVGLKPPGRGVEVMARKEFRWTRNATTHLTELKESVG